MHKIGDASNGTREAGFLNLVDTEDANRQRTICAGVFSVPNYVTWRPAAVSIYLSVWRYTEIRDSMGRHPLVPPNPATLDAMGRRISVPVP